MWISENVSHCEQPISAQERQDKSRLAKRGFEFFYNMSKLFGIPVYEMTRISCKM